MERPGKKGDVLKKGAMMRTHMQMPRTLAKLVWLVLLGGAMAVTLTDCPDRGGVTAEEAEQLRAQVTDVEQRLANVEAMIADMQDAGADAREDIAAASARWLW